MAEQLQSLKDTFRERGREAVVAQLQSCAQKGLRATASWRLKARPIGTENLNHCLNALLRICGSNACPAFLYFPKLFGLTAGATLRISLWIISDIASLCISLWILTGNREGDHHLVWFLSVSRALTCVGWSLNSQQVQAALLVCVKELERLILSGTGQINDITTTVTGKSFGLGKCNW